MVQGVEPEKPNDPEERSGLAVRKPVERLFPFVLRSRVAVVGRETLWRLRSRLAFLLMATDISENSRREIRRDFSRVPVFERYTAAELEGWFHYRNCRVLGVKKSDLARSILKELKATD